MLHVCFHNVQTLIIQHDIGTALYKAFWSCWAGCEQRSVVLCAIADRIGRHTLPLCLSNEQTHALIIQRDMLRWFSATIGKMAMQTNNGFVLINSG